MFININDIIDPKVKKYFIEKVDLFNKITTIFLSNNSNTIKNFDIDDSIVYYRLIELNIINSKDEISNLKDILKKERFDCFLYNISFSLANNKLIGEVIDKFNPISRSLVRKNTLELLKPKVVDLFCGAGGMSLGFTQSGFRVDFANDNEDVCIQTYKYNHMEIPDDRVVLGDIRKIVDHLDLYNINNIDVVVGGPPCQGFSSANQQRVIDDPRNELYRYFIKAINKIEPKFVVMENVKGMLPYAQQVEEDYQNIRTVNNFTYDVSYKVLASDDFGVSQKRQRLIFIAVRNDISELLNISSECIFSDISKSNLNTRKHVLMDAIEFIKPLKSPRVKNMTEVDDEYTGKKVDNNFFVGNENSYLRLINQNKRIPLVFNHKARYTNDINYEIYRRMNQGDDGTSDTIKDIMPYKHRSHIFKDKYFKLVADRPSKTITAHLRMDCHSHIHPFQTRSITPREAARIQSFPDDYIFLGPYLKTYMQIGNAVPPLMAKSIAKVIKKYLN